MLATGSEGGAVVFPVLVFPEGGMLPLLPVFPVLPVVGVLTGVGALQTEGCPEQVNPG